MNAQVSAFVQSGLSITVAARGERLVPSIAMAVGCRVDEARRGLTVLLFADVAETVCRDIAFNGQVAVCFSRPSTLETIQLKGSNARSVVATATDMAAARRCLDLLLDDFATMRFDRRVVESALWHDPADLIAIRFDVADAFAQTPGPSAGAPLAMWSHPAHERR
jgi:hypothetical protein